MSTTGSRRGFSLIELLIALVMLGLFSTAFYKVLVSVQRVSGKQTEVANMQGNLRSGLQLVQSELQELETTDAATSETDIYAMSGTAIRYRAMRGVGEACEVAGDHIRIRKSNFLGPHDPDASLDSLAIYWDGDTTQVADDSWLMRSMGSVGSGTCPDDGNPGWNVALNLSGQVATMYPPFPIRTYEEMEMGLVTDAGNDWLGIRAVNKGETTLLPVIGPLATGGVNFQYYDINGNAISGSSLSDRSTVKVIQLTLIGQTARAVHRSVGSLITTPADTMVIRVQLRNSR